MHRSRRVQNRFFLWMVVLCLSGMVLTGQAGEALAADCVDFEEPLVSPPDYRVGDSFSDSGSQITGIAFEWLPSGWTSDGVAKIVLGSEFWCDAGGSGKELTTNNINVRIDFPEVLAEGLTVRFAEHGGSVNIGINGLHTNVEDFADIHSTTIAGVLVACTGPGCTSEGAGELRLEGSINEFYIGGQEFCIDDVCPIPPGSSCAGSAEASSLEAGPAYGASDLAMHLAFFLLPAGVVVGLRIWRRKR